MANHSRSFPKTNSSNKKCLIIHSSDFMPQRKGCIPWNKGKKGTTKPNSGCFKKGQNRGEKNNRWRGGKSAIQRSIRRMPEYRLWRSSIYERDCWTCQTCGARGNNHFLTAHHIMSFISIIRENDINTIDEARVCPAFWDISNGVTLCEECHALTDNYRGRGRMKSV
jgi:hypothetical protein